MDTTRYAVGVLVVTFMPPGMLWWFLIHPFIGFWRRVGATVTLTVMGVIGVAGIAGLMTVRSTIVGRDLGTHPAVFAAAGALFVLQVVLAVQRKRQLPTRVLVGIPELTADGGPGTLLTEGIYGRIRHPRYAEIAAGTLAMALFSGYTGPLVVAAVTLPVLHLIVLLEERELLARFGPEYEAYCARVPRYLPLRTRPRE